MKKFFYLILPIFSLSLALAGDEDDNKTSLKELKEDAVGVLDKLFDDFNEDKAKEVASKFAGKIKTNLQNRSETTLKAGKKYMGLKASDDCTLSPEQERTILMYAQAYSTPIYKNPLLVGGTAGILGAVAGFFIKNMTSSNDEI